MPQRPRLTPAMADVRRSVREAYEHAGLARGNLVLVACSGGADSLALAAASKFEGDRAGIAVGAVIVEHGLQEVTKQVAEDTSKRLLELGLAPVLITSVTVGSDGGTEAAARTVRYQALESIAREQGASAVLLGHTLSDQAETVLLGMARGSGLKSIAGMSEVTPADSSTLIWLRPLLGITRKTTEDSCRDSGLSFWVDPHNSDKRFSRVRVRTDALPALEEALGPGVAQALARTAELVQEDLAYLEAIAGEEFTKLVKTGPTGVTISAAALGELPGAISGRVIHRCLAIFGDLPGKVHVDRVYELVRNWHGQKELTLPGVRVVRQGDAITFKSSRTLRPGAC